jgi:hypothetical protein
MEDMGRKMKDMGCQMTNIPNDEGQDVQAVMRRGMLRMFAEDKHAAPMLRLCSACPAVDDLVQVCT